MDQSIKPTPEEFNPNQEHYVPRKDKDDIRDDRDDNFMDQARVHHDAECRVVFEHLTQKISQLEQRVMDLEKNRMEGKASHIDDGALDSPMIGEDAFKNVPPPSTIAYTNGTDPTDPKVGLNVAKPNEFSGNIRVSYVTFRDDRTGANKRSIDTKPPFKRPEDENKGLETPSLVFSTFIDDKGKWTRTEVEIKSRTLIAFLRNFLFDTLKHAGLLPLWSQEASVHFSSRFLVSVPNYNELKMISQESSNCSDKQINNETTEELKCLIDHVEQYETAHIQMRKSTEKLREVTSESLWTLFPVGTEIVGKWFMETPQIFIVKDFLEIPRLSGLGLDAIVSCWCYDWDGQKLVKTTYSFTIRETKGPKSIIELPCYPLQYHPKKDDLLKELIQRGSRFRELYLSCQRSGSLMKCQGPMFRVGGLTDRRSSPNSSDDENEDSNDENRQHYGSSDSSYDIIVDAAMLIRDYGIRIGKESARSEYNDCTCMYCKMIGSEQWENAFKSSGTDVDKTLSENYSYLLPPRVLGVIVKQKMFAQLPINQISLIDSQDFEKGWNKLQLHGQHKYILQDMVAAQLDHRPQSEQTIIQDLIPGKGEGLVILLHGVPGVGKTTTAEALARYLKCHILRIDASDFDYERPGQVGSILKKYFQLAYSWGVILLLDEADIFLQTRMRSEIKQNALVSVLLTQVEYFQGVLIMTTNRIMSIDIAVQSRLHYAIRFDYLNMDELRGIFETFQAQLDDSNCDTDEREKIRSWWNDNLGDMKERCINGRDIRNLFMGTQLLAKKRGGRIRLDHLKRVHTATQKFRTEMERTRLQKEAEMNVVNRGMY